MLDPHGRKLRSMRISVTQRCNLNCLYCHREGQERSLKEISPEQIEKIVRTGKSLGITKLKITGGEPLLRGDILEIVESSSRYVDEVSMTTNGTFLEELAADLKSRGLRRVNVSIDSLNPEHYKLARGKDCLSKVLAGVERAISVGLNPVKLNTVILRGVNEEDIQDLLHYACRKGAVLQLIELTANKQDMQSPLYNRYHVDLSPFEEAFQRIALSWATNSMHSRKRYVLQANGGKVEVEVVRPMNNSEFCKNCNRIRVTSDGKLKPCLLTNEGEVDVFGEQGFLEEEMLEKKFLEAIKNRQPYWR